MYIVELTGRCFKAQGAGCLIHNETMRMPSLWMTHLRKLMLFLVVYIQRSCKWNGYHIGI